MWETAPCSTLPTADENVVVTTVSSSLFQSATVVTKNEFLYFSVLLSDILKPQVFRISCLAMVLSESQPLKMVGLILLRFLSAGIEVFWRRGWDVALNSLVNTHGHVSYDRCDGYGDKTGLGK